MFSRERDERGAILLQVSIAMVALLSFAALVTDYGVLWASRRQAQNAADAAALAGAISLGKNPDFDIARAVAKSIGQSNKVFGLAPNITLGSGDSVDEKEDISFPLCPTGSPGAGTKSCIRVNVYRNEVKDALPTFFGKLFGQQSQGVKATATAEILSANSTDCLKPWAVVDKWSEHYPVNPAPWTIDSTFDKYDKKGDVDPKYVPPDEYIAPTADDFGSGFHPFNDDGTFSSDYGLELWLKVGAKTDFDFATGWFAALALEDSTGGKDYKNNIKNCVGTTYTIGDELPINTEPGEKVGPTKQGTKTDADSIIQQDPGAYWDPTLNDGHGGVAGSCCGVSPRIVAIPLVNPDIMADAQKGGRTSVPIANIMAFFVEDYEDKGVKGRLITMPGKFDSSGGTADGAFLQTIILVR